MKLSKYLIIITLLFSESIYGQKNTLTVEKKLISIGNYSYSSSANLSYYKNSPNDSVFILRYNGSKNYKFNDKDYVEINTQQSLDTLYNEMVQAINSFTLRKTGSDSYTKEFDIANSSIRVLLFSYKKLGKIHFIMSLSFANKAEIEDYKSKHPNWNYDNSERYKLRKKLFVGQWFLCDNDTLQEFESTKLLFKELFGKTN